MGYEKAEMEIIEFTENDMFGAVTCSMGACSDTDADCPNDGWTGYY